MTMIDKSRNNRSQPLAGFAQKQDCCDQPAWVTKIRVHNSETRDGSGFPHARRAAVARGRRFACWPIRDTQKHETPASAA